MRHFMRTKIIYNSTSSESRRFKVNLQVLLFCQNISLCKASLRKNRQQPGATGLLTTHRVHKSWQRRRPFSLSPSLSFFPMFTLHNFKVITVANSGSWSVLTPNLGGFSPFRSDDALWVDGLCLTPEMTDIGTMSLVGEWIETCFPSCNKD